MKPEIQKKSEMYKVFNDIILKNEIIIFGSTFAANFPFYELAKKYLLSNALYNRSIDNLTVDDAGKILDECVLNAKPSKIFYALGEYDIKDNGTINQYKKILERTKSALPHCVIYVLSVCSTDKTSTDFNLSLKNLCTITNTNFISIDYTTPCDSIFKQLTPFFRSRKIDFAEALMV